MTSRVAWAAVCLAAALFLLWILRGAILLIFGAILVAILLDLLAAAICRLTPLHRGLALAIATALVLAALAACFWLFGTSLSAQFGNIVQRVKTGEKELEHLLAGIGVDPSLIGHSASRLGGAAAGIVGYALSLAEITVLVAVMAVYLAAEPSLYREGLARLVPDGYRKPTAEALRLIGASLRLWLAGQLLLMLIVGVLAFLALSAIGVPNAGALALVTAVTEAIPYLGPFIGAIPTILVALSQSLSLAIWAALFYLLAHLIEGYLVGPVVQRWFVRIPPVLILGSIFACQMLFGLAGLVLAAPIAVAIFAAVKIVYVRDVLHRPAEMPERSPLG
jgi:predicted PurR-regulated permease PerM